MARKKRMDYRSFLRYLRRTRDENIWRLTSSGYLRILGSENPDCDRSYCPITSVCLRLIGTRHSEGNYWDAAEDINLDGRIVDTIVRAADNHATTTRQRQVRRSLLRAVGLQWRRV